MAVINSTTTWSKTTCADWQLAGDWRIYGQISRESGDSYTKDYDVSVGVKRRFF